MIDDVVTQPVEVEMRVRFTQIAVTPTGEFFALDDDGQIWAMSSLQAPRGWLRIPSPTKKVTI